MSSCFRAPKINLDFHCSVKKIHCEPISNWFKEFHVFTTEKILDITLYLLSVVLWLLNPLLLKWPPQWSEHCLAAQHVATSHIYPPWRYFPTEPYSQKFQKRSIIYLHRELQKNDKGDGFIWTNQTFLRYLLSSDTDVPTHRRSPLPFDSNLIQCYAYARVCARQEQIWPYLTALRESPPRATRTRKPGSTGTDNAP